MFFKKPFFIYLVPDFTLFNKMGDPMELLFFESDSKNEI